MFRELSKVGLDELCAPRAAARRKVNNKACNYYTQMAEITAKAAGWKDKSAQKINAACIRRHLSAAVQSGTSIAGSGRPHHLADTTILTTYGHMNSERRAP
jgi:hypothetical protein